MHSTTAFFLIPLFLAPLAGAQSIQYVESRKVWLLTTRESSYAMGVAGDGLLEHLYWGPPLWRADDLPVAPEPRGLSSFDPSEMMANEEYPAFGGPRYLEPALKITRDDGDRDVVLHYVSQQIRGNDLDIELKDIHDDILVTLHYHIYPDNGILRRNATIRNGTGRPLTVESAQSAAWSLPPGDGYNLSYLSGRWAAETQLHREPIEPGMKVLESRKGNTSHNLNPWFAIDAGNATEENGPVWFGALGWSGNWRITVEQTPYRQVRVTGGMNSFDFSYPLKPGESLETPEFYAGYSSKRIRRRLPAAAPLRTRADSSRRPFAAGCGRCSTTRGKPPNSTSPKRARNSSPTRRRNWVWSCL